MDRNAQLSDIEDEVALLDAMLEPIANRPVDITDLRSFESSMRTLAESNPLEEAGIEAEAKAVLRSLLTHYGAGDDATRTAIRGMFDRYTSFRWAAGLPFAPTPEGFRTRLLHLSARDQGADPRDELVELDQLCAVARDAGVDIKPILREVAEISSDVDRYGMGSTRGFLLARAR